MNRKVLAGLAAAGLALFLFAPSSLGRFAPLLVALACPLSMIFMMRSMSGGRCDRTATGDEAEAARRRAQQPAAPTADVEVLRLRAEVDQLRAELSAHDPASSARSEPDPVRSDPPR
jgi:hypothetical protein